MNTALLIPIYEPSIQTVSFIQQLQKALTIPILIVNDGSDESYAPYFDKMQDPNTTLLSYRKNRGKGAALKHGLWYLKETRPDITGVVTADGDGQHDLEDIKKMIDRLPLLSADSLLLGTRDFSLKTTPVRSWFGNRMTSFFYLLASGQFLQDTQTGLRGFRSEAFDQLLKIPGDRFEYEMNQLLELPRQHFNLVTIPIKTIYEKKNHQSHFRTVQDSYLVYRPLVKFLLSSGASAVVDITLFTLFMFFIADQNASAFLIATVFARLLSGIFNYHLNRKMVFDAPKSTKTFTKYAFLFSMQLLLSWLGVTALSQVLHSLLLCKLLIDFSLFLASFAIQRRIVFT